MLLNYFKIYIITIKTYFVCNYEKSVEYSKVLLFEPHGIFSSTKL